MKLPASSWPMFTPEESAAVASVLMSNRVNYWTGGQGKAFEKEFAEWVGVKHAIALSNGTVALDLALHGLGIGAANGGSATDQVIVTPRSFIASVSCVVNAGAIPVFADVNRDSGNLTADTVRQVISTNSRAIILVHLGGYPADLDPILNLVEEKKLKLIEDCAQAHGARYQNKSVGSFGHVGAWSFCQDKIMSTGGEGGMVTTDSEALWSKMWSFKDHGKKFEKISKQLTKNSFRWVHDSFGTNWRMLEMQAAIGRIQLNKMPEWNALRRRNAKFIAEVLKVFSGPSGVIRLPNYTYDNETDVHGFYKFYCYVEKRNLASGWDRDRIIEEISKRGVKVFQGACPEIYLEKAFQGTEFAPKDRLPVAREIGESSLMFLVHPTITASELELTASVLKEVLSTASRA